VHDEYTVTLNLGNECSGIVDEDKHSHHTEEHKAESSGLIDTMEVIQKKD